jgi:formylglycine-generating enzyme required for sulfatase activity
VDEGGSVISKYLLIITGFFVIVIVGTGCAQLIEPDLTDLDRDKDGFIDAIDEFPTDATEWKDTDGDGIGDNADTDDDGDGCLDTADTFPKDVNECVDTDGDGVGDNADTDDDNDGSADSVDPAPKDPTIACEDTDSDGICNTADTDDDGDGCLDTVDDAPLNSAICFTDTDGDGTRDSEDTDDDNDGCLDVDDDHPLNAALCFDNDGDGVENSSDAFPNDATEWTDADSDTVGSNADCNDSNANVSTNHHEICSNSTDDNCSGTTDEIGCMILITGGTFNMGADTDDADGQGTLGSTVHDVTLSNYYLDAYEVTNALFEACVTAGSCSAPNSLNSTYGNSSYDKWPIFYIDWNQASAYCTYVGKRLPTESEWEYAARNGSDEETYPWGIDAPTTTLANYFVPGNSGVVDDVDQFSAGNNDDGIFNLIGNVAEWVSDFAGDYPLEAAAAVTDPTGPALNQTSNKIFRGGSFSHSASGPNQLEGKDRFSVDPTTQSTFIGVRCASTTSTKN